MPDLLLVIKSADPQSAKAFCKAHGIEDFGPFFQKNCETHLRVSETNLLSVQKWFNEEATCEAGFGYPFGTLLFFNRVP